MNGKSAQYPYPATRNSGTNITIMGAPSGPMSHQDNQKPAFWGAAAHQNPYLHYTSVNNKANNSPMESALHVLNSWSTKAEIMANNIWQNMKVGSSVSSAAWGKVNLTVKAMSGGGFESMYKQIFPTHQTETLKKTFACYMSTSTGPVAGTLYLSNSHLAFCSDLPLLFTAPSGQQSWSYYKVMVPLGKIGGINPIIMRESPSEKYIQILTIDGHDFWFMGFVSYEKASRYLSESLSKFIVSGPPIV